MAASNHDRKVKKERQHRMDGPGDNGKAVPRLRAKKGRRRAARPIKYR